MATVKPFAALRPKSELASRICELPYDVMSSEEARAMDRLADSLEAAPRVLIDFDDAAGDRARIAAARRHIVDFGFSAECGWGRTQPGRLPGLLAGHRSAAEAF